MSAARDTDFFDYELPNSLIAERPTTNRLDAKLLLVDGSGEEVVLRDSSFREISAHFRRGDCLVLNDSRVLPTRFFAIREGTTTEIEVLLVARTSSEAGEKEVWDALVRPARKLKPEMLLSLTASLQAKYIGRKESDNRICQFELEVTNPDISSVSNAIKESGLMPIPPYIRQGRSDDRDRIEYQTEFAREDGSIAAPTAGLHFTRELLEELQDKGVHVCYLTLHVGMASFLPLPEEIDETAVGKEYFHIPADTARSIAAAKRDSRRVIAVGTTTTRALESIGLDGLTRVREGDGELAETEIFIKPGYQFSVVDSLITNFHQPRTTHLLMVSAFVGVAAIEAAYRHALSGGYRFLSYGDGMWLEEVRR